MFSQICGIQNTKYRKRNVSNMGKTKSLKLVARKELYGKAGEASNPTEARNRGLGP